MVTQFLDKTLPLENWDHQAHIMVAIWHLTHFSKAEATHLLRCRIIEYNHSQGTGNSFASGYHETVTLLWIWLLDNFIATYPSTAMDAVNHFLSTPLASGQWIGDLYTSETLASDEARALWTEPDKHPLDFEYLGRKYNLQ